MNSIMALHNSYSKQDFNTKVIQSDKTVLVDFWAAWCPPCRAMEPTLKEVAESMDEKLDVVKVNVDESPENAALAAEYGVQGIPNMQVFKDGKVVQELVGMRPAGVLKQELSSLV